MKQGRSVECSYVAVASKMPAEDGYSSAPMLEDTTVEVVAPATLPEGYELTVHDAEGRSFAVEVPSGGVQEGTRFSAVILRESLETSSTVGSHHIVSGRWRDSWQSCCIHGCCHRVMCLAIWCPTILLGQIMTRMKLDPLANPQGHFYNGWTPFKVMLALVVFFYSLDNILSSMVTPYVSPPLDDYGNPAEPASDIPGWVSFVLLMQSGLRMSYILYVLYVGVRTRAFIRRKYQIPETCCRGYEDACCMVWCSCCSVSQMARHTADYDVYAAACCTETGLPPQAPGVD